MSAIEFTKLEHRQALEIDDLYIICPTQSLKR